MQSAGVPWAGLTCNVSKYKAAAAGHSNGPPNKLGEVRLTFGTAVVVASLPPCHPEPAFSPFSRIEYLSLLLVQSSGQLWYGRIVVVSGFLCKLTWCNRTGGRKPSAATCQTRIQRSRAGQTWSLSSARAAKDKLKRPRRPIIFELSQKRLLEAVPSFRAPTILWYLVRRSAPEPPPQTPLQNYTKRIHFPACYQLSRLKSKVHSLIGHFLTNI